MSHFFLFLLNRVRRISAVRWVLVVAGIALLILPAVALARAGGGGGYSGGGRGGGGGGGGGRSGSSGGSGGDLIDLVCCIVNLIQLCYDAPYIGFPIVFLLGGFIVYAAFTGKNVHQTSVIRKANKTIARASAASIAEQLRQRDPAFDQETLFARIRDAFVKIQYAWSNQNLSAVRPFISDAVFERFSIQFEEQKAMGLRNRMDQVTIGSVELANGRCDERFDALTLRIEASALDQEVALADGRVLSGSPRSESFVEMWTFLRRRGAVSQPGKPGLIEGNCPNCGGAIEMNQSAQCKFCKAALRSGQYDWVLSEITQECEWQPGGDLAIPGADELARRDPEFNVQELEDRASVVFWRRAAAERLNTARPLRKMALAEYCDQFDQAAAARAGRPRWYMGMCAVGSVDTRGVIPASSGQQFDTALVEVRWSGTRMDVLEGGAIRRGEQSMVTQSLLVLVRKAGVRSNPDQSISSAHCPTCGAPEEGGASGACDFCGTALGDGSHGWVLQESVAMTSPRTRDLLDKAGRAAGETSVDAVGSAAPPRLASATVLSWMVKMAFADGNIDPREEKLIYGVARRYGIDTLRVQQMIEAARGNQLQVEVPADKEQARQHLRAMAQVALADGRIDRLEYRLLREAGGSLGLTDHDIGQLLRRTKSEMYAQAKKTLKQMKK